MQFKLELIQAMRDGEKVQTRRVKRRNEELINEPPTTVVITDYNPLLWEREIVRLKWQVGRRYAINPPPGPEDKGRMGKAVGSYECVGLREERLQDISETDCQAESIQQYKGSTPYAPWGFPGREGGWLSPRRAFMGLWNTIAKPSELFADNPPVFVIEMGEFEWEGE